MPGTTTRTEITPPAGPRGSWSPGGRGPSRPCPTPRWGGLLPGAPTPILPVGRLDGTQRTSFLPRWQVRLRGAWARRSQTLAKKGSGRPKSCRQLQVSAVSPPSPPLPCRESWQSWPWLWSMDLRPCLLRPETAWGFLFAWTSRAGCGLRKFRGFPAHQRAEAAAHTTSWEFAQVDQSSLLEWARCPGETRCWRGRSCSHTSALA